jgi:hypothetical protein
MALPMADRFEKMTNVQNLMAYLTCLEETFASYAADMENFSACYGELLPRVDGDDDDRSPHSPLRMRLPTRDVISLTKEEAVIRAADCLTSVPTQLWSASTLCTALGALRSSATAGVTLMRHVMPKLHHRLTECQLDDVLATVLKMPAGLYCLQFFDDVTLVRNTASVAEACARFGPAWDVSLMGSFAAHMPRRLLLDLDFVINSVSRVNDGGLSLLICSKYTNRRRLLALGFVGRQLCLQHTEFADDEEVVMAALCFNVLSLNHASFRLQKSRAVLRFAAARGPEFFSTKAGFYLRADLDLALAAAALDRDGLLEVLAPSLQKNPSLLAAMVAAKFRSNPSPAALLVAGGETSGEFFRELLRRDFRCLGVLAASQRSDRELVFFAALQDPAALSYALPSVWNQDGGFHAFVELLIAGGCSKEHMPVAWGVYWASGNEVERRARASRALLRNRRVWPGLPSSVQELFPDCVTCACCICYELPLEFFGCAGGCSGHVCGGCADLLIRASTSSTQPTSCPMCRKKGASYGPKSWAASTLVKRELEGASRSVKKMILK